MDALLASRIFEFLGIKMKLRRRKFLHLTAAVATLPMLSSFACAQTYPARSVRIIVGFPPATASDNIARMMGQWLSERLGQEFRIENQPGASGNIGTETVVRAPPDGYTLLLVVAANATNATLYRDLQFNFIRDIAPVAGISRDPNVMVVNPLFPVSTVPGFIAYAKANPGRIKMASAGVGTSPHMAGELFKYMAGVDMTHVPYRGSPAAMTDLFGGQVQVYFAPIAASIKYVRAGKLRALAVTTATRVDALPNIPTVGDFVPGYEASALYGVGVPKNTLTGIVDRLNKEINAGLVDTKMKARLADLGSSAFVGSPSDFGKLIADETEKWAKVIRIADIKPE